MKKLALVLGAVLVFTLVSCGADTDSDSQAALEAAEQRVAELEDAASSTSVADEAPTETGVPATTAAPAATPPPTEAPIPPSTEAPVTTPEAATSLMPDVVCMNLQAAQDFIQSETDVFFSRSEDATGAGRSQIMDRNWIVVAQRPAPGTPIGEGDAVLSAVKLEEANPC